MAQIDINFTGGIEGGSSNEYLVNILNKLNATLAKLNITTIKSATSEPFSKPKDQFKETSQGFEKAINEFNSASEKALKELGSKIGTVLGASIGITASRYLNNQADAIMGRATASGKFIADSIGGNANQAYGGYVSSLFDIERQRQLSNGKALAEGAGGAVGGIMSAVGGTLKDSSIPGISGLGSVLDKGGLLAGATGATAGKLAYAKLYGQDIEQKMIVQGAKAKLMADASVSQWKSGFDRFGLTKTSTELVPGSMTANGKAINADIAQEFVKKYGSSQNFKAIQENIVPYMPSNSNILSSKNGDLSVISQQFLKAGFAVSDFSRLTMQSSQYSAITGKNFKEFGNDIAQARRKFGDAYDVSTNQTALNLMTLGYGKDQAQHIAYQSQFNQGVGSNVGQWANQGFSEFYRNKFLSKSVGFDINASLQSGSLVGASKETRAQINRELKDYQSGKGIGNIMTLLMGSGVTNYSGLRSLVQGQVAEKKLTEEEKTKLTNPDMSSAQKESYKSGTVENLLSNVNSMMVNAINVTIVNNGSKSPTPQPNMPPPSPPMPSAPSTSPAKP